MVASLPSREDVQVSAWPAYLIGALALPFAVDPGFGLLFFALLLLLAFFALRAAGRVAPWAMFLIGRQPDRRATLVYLVQTETQAFEMHLHPPQRGASLAGGDEIRARGALDRHGVFHARRVEVVRRADQAGAASLDAGRAPSTRGPWLAAGCLVAVAVIRVLLTG